MFKTKRAALLCAAALLLTGCAAKDDFADYSLDEPPQVDGISAKTEFAEYDGDTEGIRVFLTNDNDEPYSFDYNWQLAKRVDDEWKVIRFINEENAVIPLDLYEMPRGTVSIWCDLKDNVKLPLLSGQYRMRVGHSGERVPAEFTVKE